MIALHGALEALKLGFRKEHRRFTPHLTLGRVRSSGPAVAALGELLAAGRFLRRQSARMKS